LSKGKRIGWDASVVKRLISDFQIIINMSRFSRGHYEFIVYM
jgi:hypothetical protein